jgi:hypothetical protein
MAYAILRFAKLKTWGQIAGSLSHNYRTRDTPNADDERSHLNEHSHETTQDVKNDLVARLPEKYRKDAVMCLEHLITTSPDWDGWGTKKEAEFFEQSKKWLEERYGKENIVATSIHRDETTPHLVCYVVPLDPEKGTLNAKRWTGGGLELSKMQTSFAEKIEHLGIERGLKGSKAEHVPIAKFYEKVNSALDYEIQAEKIPKKGLLEFSENYAQRVLESALPDYEKNRVLATETLDLKKENQRLRSYVKKAEVYFDSIQGLNTENRQNFDFLLQEESSKLLSKQEKQEAEKIAKKQAEKELQEKVVSELTATFRTFESYHDREFFKREASQKDLNDQLKKSEKWLKKMGLSEQDLFETDVLGRSKHEKPDFFLSSYDYERKYEKADSDFTKSIGSKAYELGIFKVVDELKAVTSSKKLLTDLEHFAEAVPAVYEAHLKENSKLVNEHYETQRKNAQFERERAESQKRDEEHQKLVNERIRKNRAFEAQNSDYSPKKPKKGNDFTP